MKRRFIKKYYSPKRKRLFALKLRKARRKRYYMVSRGGVRF